MQLATNHLVVEAYRAIQKAKAEAEAASPAATIPVRGAQEEA